MNAGRRPRFAEELAELRPLPERRLDSTRHERVRVSPGSLIYVHRNAYSVHSRLIGEMVEARVEAAIRLLLNNEPEQLTAPAIKLLIEATALRPLIPNAEVDPVPLTVFDELLSGNEVAA